MEDPPQIKGVVIITLPPIDNPSLGKTITAFTLSDSSPPSPLHHHHHEIPSQLSQIPELGFSFRRSFVYNPRFLLVVLGISLVTCLFMTSSLSKTLTRLRNSNGDDNDEDNRDRNSFIFPLYRKWSNEGMSSKDVEFKLGRFVEPVDARLKSSKVNKLVSTTAASVQPSAIFPVRGNIYPDGLYYTYILVGTPQRPYYLDMDTGSDLTWLQCDAPCTSCAKGPHPLYNPTKGNIIPSKDSLCIEVQRNEKSKDCETCEQCDYEIEYADHSSSMGVLARDKLHLMLTNGSLTNFDMVFGCAYDQQGMLLNSLKRTDGILGLSRSKVSLPSQLSNKGIINNVVGHCLATDLSSGGYMFLGDDFVPYWGMSWVSMLNKPSMDFYHTEIVKMSYGSKELSSFGRESKVGRVVFDSGSSYTYFTKETYSDLLASLSEIPMDDLMRDESDPTLPICWRAKFPIRSVMDVKKFFKTLTLHFGTKWWIMSPKFKISPEGYLIVNKKGNVCLGILDGSKVHDGSAIILGDISLREQLIVYDNVNEKIGWGRSDCANPQRFVSLPFFSADGL